MRKAPWCSSQATRPRCIGLQKLGRKWGLLARRARRLLHASSEKCGLRLGPLQVNATCHGLAMTSASEAAASWHFGQASLIPDHSKKSHEVATVLSPHFVLPPQCGAHCELMKWSSDQKYRGGSLCHTPNLPRERRRRHHELRAEVELGSSAGNPRRRKTSYVTEARSCRAGHLQLGVAAIVVMIKMLAGFCIS